MATVLLVPAKPNSSPVFRAASDGITADFAGLTVSDDRLLPDLVFFALKLNPIQPR